MTAHTPAAYRRMLARVLVLAAVAIGALLGVASPAAAHPTLLYTTPAAETAEPTPPEVIVLVFGEPVTVAPGGLSVADDTGRTVSLAAPERVKDGHAVTARITRTLPTGVYTVSWRVTGADGDLVEGRFRFAVGATLNPQTNADTGGNGPSWPVTIYRLALLAGLTLGVGGMVAEAMQRRARTVNPTLPHVPAWTSISGLAGAVAAVALAIGVAADSGDLSSIPARIAVTQAAAFGVIVIAQAAGRARLTVVALAVIAVAEALRAHPNIAWPGWGALLTFVHVAAAALWAGTLAHLLHIAIRWRAHPGAVRWLVAVYARLALWLVVAVVATGCVMALLLVPAPTIATTAYGRLLLAKLCLVAAAIAAAWRALHRADKPHRVLRPARVEAALLGAVLAAAATLTGAAPSPADANAGQLPPPPAEGLVLPLGTLAGQIGVGVEASDGRLVVRLVTPSRDDYYATSRTRQTYTLTGRLVTAGSTQARDLDLTGCGPGCYLADTPWADGDNLLTLHASAPGWTGGTVSMIVAWPVADGATRLRQVVSAMRAQPEISYTETVTSDTSQPTGEPTPIRLPSAEFLALQPYGTGVAPQVVTLPATAAGQTRLALGFPAEGRYVQLTLDAQHRIIDEVQVDPKHLTRRQY